VGRLPAAGSPRWAGQLPFGAEIVLAGHDHVYERFGSQDAQAQADPERGLRRFTARGRKHLRVRRPIAEQRGPRVGDLRDARADPP
jgi:hypothetical protein